MSLTAAAVMIVIKIRKIKTRKAEILHKILKYWLENPADILEMEVDVNCANVRTPRLCFASRGSDLKL